MSHTEEIFGIETDEFMQIWPSGSGHWLTVRTLNFSSMTECCILLVLMLRSRLFYSTTVTWRMFNNMLEGMAVGYVLLLLHCDKWTYILDLCHQSKMGQYLYKYLEEGKCQCFLQKGAKG